MKTNTLTLLVFLLFSCSTFKEWKLDYLKSKYKKEYQFCEDVLIKKVRIKSFLNDTNIIHISIIKNNLDIHFSMDEIEYLNFNLVEINRYNVDSYKNGIPPVKIDNLNVVYTLKNEKGIENVLCFYFIYEKGKFKLFDIDVNASKYYMYRKPKVNQPNLPFY